MYFSTTEVTKILKISYPRLREWIDRKYITPSIIPDGPGSRTSFSLSDIYKTKIFMELLSLGYGRREAANRVREIGESDEAGDRLKKKYGHKLAPITAILLIKRPSDSHGHPAIRLDERMFENDSLSSLIGGDDFQDAILINLRRLRKIVDDRINSL